MLIFPCHLVADDDQWFAPRMRPGQSAKECLKGSRRQSCERTFFRLDLRAAMLQLLEAG